MTNAFPTRWAPTHPDRLQLYSLATPNGKKAGIALEELALPYDAHRIDITAGDQFDPEFVAINPNSKIPALLDPAPLGGGDPIAIFESGAILIYLAEKAGQLLPSDARGKAEVLQWLFFQVGGVGPMFGQMGHFVKFAVGKTSDDYAKNRYIAESKRLLKVLDTHLRDHEFLAKAYSIADIATVPWIQGLAFYGTEALVGLDECAHVRRWVTQVSSRPAYQRGVLVCA